MFERSGLSPDVAAERLRSLVAEETEGAMLLIGERGLGKSHVLEHLADDHESVIVRAMVSEHGFALSGIDAVVSVLHPHMAHQFGHHLALRDTGEDGRYTAAHDVIDLIGGLHLRPTLVLVDDLDLMDDQSLAILSILLARLTGTALRVIASVTRVPPGMEALPSIRLGPLSVEAAERLLHLSDPVDQTTGRLLLDYSGGHPAVLSHHLGVLDAQQRRGRAPLTLPLRWPAELGAVVTSSLERFSARERDVLLTVALAATCPLEVLLDLTGDDELVAELIDERSLVRRGVDVSVDDQNLRAALLRHSPRAARLARHGELADRLGTSSPALTAWHRSFLSTSPSLATELFQGAADAAERGDARFAVELAEAAHHRLSVQSDDSAEAQARLVWALQCAGESALATRYTRWARSPRLNATTDLSLAASELTTSLISGRRLYDEDVEAMTVLHGGDHPEEAARLSLILAAGHLARFEPTPARAALATSTRLSSHPRLGKIAAALADVADTLDGHAIGAATVPDSGEPPEALVVLAHAMSLREEYALARRLLTRVLHHPGLRERSLVTVTRLIGLRNELSAGDFSAARRAIELWSVDPPWIWHDSSTAAHVTAWHHYISGDIAAAHEAIARCLELAAVESHTANRAYALALRGAIHLMTGDPESALADLRAVTVLSHDVPAPSLLRHWADYVESCVLTGRVSEARRAAVSLERLLARYPSRWGDHVLARVKGLVSAEASVTLLAEHVTSLDEPALHSYEGARSLVCLADRQAEVGRVAEAQRTAANAATIFDAIGATGWAAHLRLRPYREPEPEAPASPISTLTSAEQEIVRLVCEGLRNRDIAQRLYVSVRTVELRLTHVYRALDVRSRTELTALFTEHHDAA